MKRLDKTSVAYWRARTTLDENGCWVWNGYKNAEGYANVYHEGHAVEIHRLAYTIFKGTIPAGEEIDHTCWNPSCCNPDHLRALPRDTHIPLKRHLLAPTCKRGHPRTEANIYVYRGKRCCRPCNALAVRRYKGRK
jgi:hypothetical protein